ncbi:SURF1 family protein [Arsenicicoccus bolidensis]|uniref:SURF1-like protein n=1 Tax=Arsenicicoccus bolidensis TaxID=229480 RepID=A0ABS9Q501_9MICO|nr:SURF1 family protein [Arsenicicoccus bolidensis]MCG7322937.1 SURF1 family protein [Arsenicicoccus bolidensis]
MIRTALKPRWLGLLALVVLVVIAFTRLGLWQLDVSKDQGAKKALAEAQARPAAPLSQVVRPHAPFEGVMSNRRVEVTGAYDPSGQFLVPGRLLEGRTGYWVVTPLDETATRARVAVVRGFVIRPSDAPAAPTTTVTVTGTLAPGESPSDAAVPAGQLGSIDLAVLVNRWPQDLYNAFVLAGAERPDLGAGTALQRIPPPQPESQLNWRNFAYALQWWVFAAFAVYMWWRMVRDDHRSGIRPAPHDNDHPIDQGETAR